MRDKFNWESVTGANNAYQDYYPGEGSVRFGRSISLVDSSGNRINGQGMYQVFKSALDEMGVEVLLETPAKKLIVNDEGEVIGVFADFNGKQIAIKANKGVVLGTGGFDFNRKWTLEFLRGPIFFSNAVQTNTGDGHMMGMELGASLANMNENWGLPGFVLDFDKMQGEVDWALYRGKPGAIVVNRFGERIGNEASTYDLFQRAFYTYDTGNFEWRNIPSFFIADSNFAEHYRFPVTQKPEVAPDWMIKADTLEELAQKLEIDMAGLQATLDVFNPNAEEGVDPIWHRGEYPFDIDSSGDYLGRTDLKNPCLAPIVKPPFYGAPYYPGTCGTNGGLEINKNGQVLHVNGNPISRLYAVGNVSGGVMGACYPGAGGTLGAGFTFGYLAAKHALALDPVG
jgi:succinate dehydrogenase/fumarate reductase flavoprotein subunit